jgi:hypothetical protein
MRSFVLTPLSILLITSSLSAGTIRFGVSNINGNMFRYRYQLDGIVLQQDQGIDIRFDLALYQTLSNGFAPTGFSLLLLQPNNPPGAFGDFAAIVLGANPALAGIFGVDFQYIGSGQPAEQPYFINQFDSTGNFISTLQAGLTQSDPSLVPEPSGLVLVGLGLLTGVAWRLSQRRARAS